MTGETAATRLDRLARLDGYRVQEARGDRQRMAWGGQFAVTRAGAVLFTASSVYRIRAWLANQARMAA